MSLEKLVELSESSLSEDVKFQIISQVMKDICDDEITEEEISELFGFGKSAEQKVADRHAKKAEALRKSPIGLTSFKKAEREDKFAKKALARHDAKVAATKTAPAKETTRKIKDPATLAGHNLNNYGSIFGPKKAKSTTTPEQPKKEERKPEPYRYKFVDKKQSTAVVPHKSATPSAPKKDDVVDAKVISSKTETKKNEQKALPGPATKLLTYKPSKVTKDTLEKIKKQKEAIKTGDTSKIDSHDEGNKPANKKRVTKKELGEVKEKTKTLKAKAGQQHLDLGKGFKADTYKPEKKEEPKKEKPVTSPGQTSLLNKKGEVNKNLVKKVQKANAKKEEKPSGESEASKESKKKTKSKTKEAPGQGKLNLDGGSKSSKKGEK